MIRFPNEIAVQAMFNKVCTRYRETTAGGKPYIPLTDHEIEEMIASVIGGKLKPQSAPVGEDDGTIDF
jgi:hypothetical protein